MDDLTEPSTPPAPRILYALQVNRRSPPPRPLGEVSPAGLRGDDKHANHAFASGAAVARLAEGLHNDYSFKRLIEEVRDGKWKEADRPLDPVLGIHDADVFSSRGVSSALPARRRPDR